MTQTQFLEHLTGMKRKWELYDDGEIRYSTKTKEFCPIIAVAYSITKKYYDMVDYDLAAKAIGLSKTTADRIMGAADLKETSPEFNPKMRKALLTACKISEKLPT